MVKGACRRSALFSFRSVWLIMTHVCGVIFVFMCHFSHHWHGDYPQVHPTLTGLKQLNTDTISNLKFLACWFTIAKSLPQKKHLSSWYAGNLHETPRLNLNIECVQHAPEEFMFPSFDLSGSYFLKYLLSSIYNIFPACHHTCAYMTQLTMYGFCWVMKKKLTFNHPNLWIRHQLKVPSIISEELLEPTRTCSKFLIFETKEPKKSFNKSPAFKSETRIFAESQWVGRWSFPFLGITRQPILSEA